MSDDRLKELSDEQLAKLESEVSGESQRRKSEAPDVKFARRLDGMGDAEFHRLESRIRSGMNTDEALDE